MSQIMNLLPSATAPLQEKKKSFEHVCKFYAAQNGSRFPADRTMKDLRSGKPRAVWTTPFANLRTPLLLHVSGTECYVFSSMGKHEKAQADNLLTFLVWVAAVRANRPHVA